MRSSAPPHPPETPGRRSSPSDRAMRTCVGCGRTDEPGRMVRLVVSPEGHVGVDLAGGHFGRGAHVHAAPPCIASAPRGLTKSFRRPIEVTAESLASVIASAADRRALGLLASAIRARQVEVGAETAGQALASGKVHLLVVACDAAAAASVGSVMHAVKKGDAVAWGTKAKLGALVGKSEVAVLGIASKPLAVALQAAVRLASGVGHGGARAHEDHPQGPMATED